MGRRKKMHCMRSLGCAWVYRAILLSCSHRRACMLSRVLQCMISWMHRDCVRVRKSWRMRVLSCYRAIVLSRVHTCMLAWSMHAHAYRACCRARSVVLCRTVVRARVHWRAGLVGAFACVHTHRTCVGASLSMCTLSMKVCHLACKRVGACGLSSVSVNDGVIVSVRCCIFLPQQLHYSAHHFVNVQATLNPNQNPIE